MNGPANLVLHLFFFLLLPNYCGVVEFCSNFAANFGGISNRDLVMHQGVSVSFPFLRASISQMWYNLWYEIVIGIKAKSVIRM